MKPTFSDNHIEMSGSILPDKIIVTFCNQEQGIPAPATHNTEHSAAGKILVKFNSSEFEVPGGTTLGAFLEARGIEPKGIAVAVNGKVIRKADWGATPLHSGDDILVITAVCGG